MFKKFNILFCYNGYVKKCLFFFFIVMCLNVMSNIICREDLHNCKFVIVSES